MAIDRKFRFGVAGSAESGDSWRETARRAEELGYSTLLIADHMGNSVSPLIASMAALEATTRLRLSSLVLATPFRNPAIMAKEVATLNLLSGGRFEPGLGAGWPATSRVGIMDSGQTGIEFADAGVRIERLTDAVRILRLFLTSDEPFDYESQHVTIRGLVPHPKPASPTGVPIMVAGAGPRIMRFAAQEADILNIAPRPPVHGPTAAGSLGFGMTMADEIALIKEAAGERYPNLELSVNTQSPLVVASTSREEGERQIANMAEGMKISVDDAQAMPATLVGSVSELIERIQQHRDEYDISYRMIPVSAMDSFAPIVAELAGQ